MNEARAVVVAGLGLMGGAIAANLVDRGFLVSGIDPSASARDRAHQAGVQVAESIGADQEGASTLLTSLPSAAALHDLVAALVRRPGSIRRLVELSTLDLADKDLARQRLADVGIGMLDAPISGTGAQAVIRDLSIYVSGAVSDWHAVEEVLSAFAERPRYVGPFGMGMQLKLVANLLVAIHNVASAEAMALAEAAGLDLPTVVEVIREGAGNSRVFELRAPLMARRQYQPATMKLDVWSKDMDLLEAFVRKSGLAAPVFDSTRHAYAAALSNEPHDDTAAVFDIARRRVSAPR